MAIPAAPAAGAGIEGIAGLGLILAFLICLALRNAWRATIGWLFTALAGLFDRVSIDVLHHHIAPLEGVAHSLRAASANVEAALGYLALRSESSAVWLFHQAYRQIVWVGHEIEQMAQDWTMGINDLIHHEIPFQVGALSATLKHRLRGIDELLHDLSHFAHKRLREITHSLSRLAHAVTHTLPHEISGLRDRLGATAKQLRRLARRTSALEKVTVGAGAAAMVGAALSRLGLRWLKCPALGRVGRKIGCGGFGAIEEFLSVTFEALIVLDLCRYALAAQRLARIVVPQLGGVLLVQNAVCLGGGGRYPSARDKTQVSTKITLPSAHD